MESLRNNRHKKIYYILYFIAIFLIISGLWFCIVNMNKFAKGFYAYKAISPEKQIEEINPEMNVEDQILNRDLEEVLYTETTEIGEKFGELYIPKLKATLPIYEGTNEEELEKGVGHYVGSVLPGENDNSVLSGHRDTVFRKLGDVGEGDWLVVRTAAGEFKYKVNKVRIVDEDDRTVIVPKPRATLTVSTCYPFEYIGSAPQRYILVAYLVSKEVTK